MIVMTTNSSTRVNAFGRLEIHDVLPNKEPVMKSLVAEGPPDIVAIAVAEPDQGSHLSLS